MLAVQVQPHAGYRGPVSTLHNMEVATLAQSAALVTSLDEAAFSSVVCPAASSGPNIYPMESRSLRSPDLCTRVSSDFYTRRTFKSRRLPTNCKLVQAYCVDYCHLSHIILLYYKLLSLRLSIALSPSLSRSLRLSRTGPPTKGCWSHPGVG